MLKLFADIERAEALDDGTIRVWGVASSEALDSFGTIIRADAIRDALPDYLRFPTIREMHQPKAAGTADEAEVGDDGVFRVCAHIVDSEAVKKVRTGVYRGFSIGAKATARDPNDRNIVTGLRLFEVSLVDRPSNPDAVLTIMRGLCSLSDLANLMAAMVAFGRSLSGEAAAEGDGSPLPARYAAWVADGLGFMADYAAEESGEALADLQALVAASSVMPAAPDAADAALDADATIERAGRRHSAEGMKHLQAIHDHAASMGAACPGDMIERQGMADPEIVQRLEGSLAQMKADRDSLARRVSDLEARPVPDGPVLRAVAKTEDSATIADPARSRVNEFYGMSPNEIHIELMRRAQSNPVHP